MLSSCSSDDVVSNDSGSIDDNSLVPIRIGLGQTVTRGTGTVGGFTNDDDNVWYGQKINVYMLYKDSMALAEFTKTVPIYENAEFTTPNAGSYTGLATASDNSIKYYPSQGRYDFWAYRLDDAKIIGGPTRGTENLTVQFKIDGSQDVMVAKAVPSAADIENVGNRAFSAYAARHGVQPELVFKHKLARFTFEAIPGGPGAVNATSPVWIDSIKVISKNTGTLVIASTGDTSGETQNIEWTSERDSLILKDRAVGDTPDMVMKAFEPKSLAGMTVGIPEKVGDALLVAPDDEYELVIFLHQDLPNQIGSTVTDKVVYAYSSTINNTCLAGNSYNIQITLWGLTDIQITTTLTKWEQGNDGKPIELRPEDEEK
jgi:hypothetical protein